MAPQGRKVTITNKAGEKLAARLDMPDTAPLPRCCSRTVLPAPKTSSPPRASARGLRSWGLPCCALISPGLGPVRASLPIPIFHRTSMIWWRLPISCGRNWRRPKSCWAFLGRGCCAGGCRKGAGSGGGGDHRSAIRAKPRRSSFQSSVPDLEARGEADVLIGGRPFKVKKQFLDDISAHHAVDYIGRLKKALLVFHAPRDATVSIENAAEIFKAAKHPKSFVSLDNADHLLSKRADAAYVANVLANWASRYLPGLMRPATISKQPKARWWWPRPDPASSPRRSWLAATS